MSLKKKLIISMVSIAIVPVVVLGSYCYSYFSDVLLNNVQDRELRNNDQIVSHLDDFLHSLSKISDSLLMSKEILEILEKDYEGPQAQLQIYRDKRMVEEILYQNGYYLDSRIETITIFPENNDMFYYCTKQTINPNFDIKQESWYQDILKGEGGQVLLGVHTNDLVMASYAERQRYCVSLGRGIYSHSASRFLGTILINVKVEDLQNLWTEDSSINHDQERFYLIDGDNRIVYSDVPEEIGDEFFLSDLSSGITSLNQDGVLYDTLVSVSKDSGWKSVKMIPHSALGREISAIPFMTIILILFLIVLVILVALFLSMMITRPLQELYVKMKQFEAEQNGIVFQENPVEIKGLSNSYNSMIDQINTLLVENHETSLQLRRAELMAMQSQINPHFVYNTLNSIKWMADMQGSTRMVTALDSLIKLLQFSSKKESDVISIRDEISLVKDYINLINLKHFDRISVTFRMEPGVERYETLKFLLQPIVENAIYHGFAQITGPCSIEINISLIGGRILYEVLDNGHGMSQEKIAQVLEVECAEHSHSFNKIGLYNVNRRIQYTFGDEYGIKIDSQPEKYTRVLVEIPAHLYEEEVKDE